MAAQIPAQVASERFARLLKTMEAVSQRAHETMLGKKEQVLVEGLSKRDDTKISGKGTRSITITLEGTEADVGTIVPVTITSMAANTLRGERI